MQRKNRWQTGWLKSATPFMPKPTHTYSCAKCSMFLLNLNATDFETTAPKFNDLLLCGGCGTINVVGITGVHEITEEEFEALHEDEKEDLNFAQRSIKQHLKNQ